MNDNDDFSFAIMNGECHVTPDSIYFTYDWPQSGRNPMSLKLSLLVVLAFYFGCISTAQAIWSRTESVEWLTHISDIVAIVEVDNVTMAEPKNQGWEARSIKCNSLTTLKGKEHRSYVIHDEIYFLRDDASQMPKFVFVKLLIRH